MGISHDEVFVREGGLMTNWHGCYDDGWQGIIVPEAFAHPAIDIIDLGVII